MKLCNRPRAIHPAGSQISNVMFVLAHSAHYVRTIDLLKDLLAMAFFELDLRRGWAPPSFRRAESHESPDDRSDGPELTLAPPGFTLAALIRSELDLGIILPPPVTPPVVSDVELRRTGAGGVSLNISTPATVKV
eukprot:CAMPEP_0182546722 /NCGR_PEP_ID=MMETSP1323-20130603/36445_1 /TAXON_ID=236787 /ORGANISM="Florenciella parvula, Strain RCC1693" /LENGTH=134 /DNA_ID=CAMNT_0024757979 /DNA_START=56 /DNA_END=461 /DNA_ORIENTATION=+